jgi:ferredoxin-NADP reductase/Na+-translocating ferredoxin:NAD+ oxidoreductase RnfD subunit
MYRLVAYYLIALLLLAGVYAFFGILPFSAGMLLFSVAFITAVCVLTNAIFARIFRAPTNVESVYISALILALVLSPPHSLVDGQFLELACWASIWSMASKFMFAIKKKHVFNPVAFGIVITDLALGASASWWVGTLAMMPLVLIGGFLMTRKLLRWDLVLSFLATAVIVIVSTSLTDIGTVLSTIWTTLAVSPVLFFAFAMLTEPLTTPPTHVRRIVYGICTGLLFAPWAHIGSLYFTPELALVAGNIVSYVLSPKQKLLLTLKKRIPIGTDTYDFIFSADQRLAFKPGQYLEWTLPHPHADKRGNRRYFSISSSPSEKTIAMGVKFYEKGSTYKKRLLTMKPGDTLIASQLSGDFTLPRDATKKLAFMGGGIGITPFRSMIKQLSDTHEERDIVLFYANRHAEDISYKEIFDEAAESINLKTVYTLSDRAAVSRNWKSETGYIDEAMIRRELPDFQERHFYLSGPRSMILRFEQTLEAMGVTKSHIITDFFPGFA